MAKSLLFLEKFNSDQKSIFYYTLIDAIIINYRQNNLE